MNRPLASRKGDISKKSEVIEKYSELRSDEILSILQEMFPVSVRKETKRASTTSLIHVVRLSLKKLIAKKRSLQNSDLAAIEECKRLLNAILEDQTIATASGKLVEN